MLDKEEIIELDEKGQRGEEHFDSDLNVKDKQINQSNKQKKK